MALESGRDISATGSNIIATDDVSLKTGRDTVLPITLTNISVTNLGFVIGIWRIASIYCSGREIGLRFEHIWLADAVVYPATASVALIAAK